MYVYQEKRSWGVWPKSSNYGWEVGFFAPNGEWCTESYCTTSRQAAARVNYLNGGDGEVMR